jgi:hypothetical protein
MHIDKFVAAKKLEYDKWAENWKRKNAMEGMTTGQTSYKEAYPLDMLRDDWEEMAATDGL